MLNLSFYLIRILLHTHNRRPVSHPLTVMPCNLMMRFVTQYYLSFWAFKNVLSIFWHPLSSPPSPTASPAMILLSLLRPLQSHLYTVKDQVSITHTPTPTNRANLLVIWTVYYMCRFGPSFKFNSKAFVSRISCESISILQHLKIPHHAPCTMVHSVWIFEVYARPQRTLCSIK